VATQVKVCGVASLQDAELAVSNGAWAVGLVFHPESPRACDPAVGEEIGNALRRRAEVAGVFVNRPLDEVAALADLCSLTLLQLHGDEGPAYCREAARRTGCRVIKAARARDSAAVQALDAYREVDFHMLDAHDPDRFGGTGEVFDWDLAARRISRVPLILSGGLDPDNVAEAVREIHPYAVDSASGTEASPGVKDPARLEAFFRAVRAADSAQAA
jgi:phosphoribosylanthranilate isomerase